MNRLRLILFVLMVVAALLLIAGGYGEHRQATRNQALIAALVRKENGQALALIGQGADPNTPSKTLPTPSLRELWDYVLYRKPRPINESPTALQVACGNYFNDVNIDNWRDRPDAPQLVEAMLRHGAKVDSRDETGYTSLWWAAYCNHPQTAGVLIHYGADVNARAKDGWTPLMTACCVPAPEVVRVLLQKGADVNAVERDGGSVLYHAVSHVIVNPGQRKDIVARERIISATILRDILPQLLAHGADPNLAQRGSKSALQFAQANNRPDLIALFRRAAGKK